MFQKNAVWETSSEDDKGPDVCFFHFHKRSFQQDLEALWLLSRVLVIPATFTDYTRSIANKHCFL